MTSENLVCIPGNHGWNRTITRGRKPTACPKHAAVIVTAPPGPKELHCKLGNHKWLREPTRGRIPENCPNHKPVVTLNINPAPRNENGKEELHCEIGDHTWERVPARGRKPRNCPNHVASLGSSASAVTDNLTENEVLLSEYENGDAMVLILDDEFYASLPKPEVQKRVGRPKLYETKEEQTEAKLVQSRERATLLEGALKERGTHISQQTPYILYRKVSEKPSHRKGVAPTVTWEKVTEHSPLAQAQFINKNEKYFADGTYRYERNGKVVVL